LNSDAPLDGQPDAALVARYAAVRDEEAFRELVRRHGPMVLCTCARMLGHRQDAEDAFQAVFLVLAARRRALRRVRSLGGWLHSVAIRVSCGMLRSNRRRERRLAAISNQHPAEEDGRVRELEQVLDEELAALPAKYREALVLCDLEGHTREEAGRRLNTSASAIAKRVTRGRKLLGERLVRRGVTFGAGGLAAALAHGTAAGLVLHSGLINETLRIADLFLLGARVSGVPAVTKITSLAQGELTKMFLAKIGKSVCMIALIAALWFGAPPVSGVVGLVSRVRANTVLFDDFNDGAATDGSPWSWRPWDEGGVGNGVFDASTGDFVLTPNADVPLGAILNPSVNLTNLSIRTQVRNTGSGDATVQGTGMIVHADFANPNWAFFDCGIGTNGNLYIVSHGPNIDLAETQTNLRPLEEDVVLQLDLIGNSLRLFAWRLGEPMPAQPQVQATSNLHASGSIGIYYNPPTGNGTGTFRFVHIATAPIPEPSSIALGSLGALALAGLAFRIRLNRFAR
jgi:RNA polymerase sigma factor (sigma-70 family)